MNLSDLPTIQALATKRTAVAIAKRQFEKTGMVSLALFVTDEDGDPGIGTLDLTAEEFPDASALFSRLISNLHDDLVGAGINVDTPLIPLEQPTEEPSSEESATEPAE